VVPATNDPARAPLDSGDPNGSAATPDAGALSITSLLNQEVDASTFGSDKYRLPRHGISAYVHGTANVGFIVQDKADPGGAIALHDVSGHPSTFHRFGFNAFVGADINDIVFPELQIETASEELAVRYAQVDVRLVQNFLFLRVGEFLVPMGALNGYPDPFFLHKLAETPLMYRNVMPSKWSQTGVQLYGRAALSTAMTLEYAVYVVNGLQQTPDATNPNAVTEGGNVYEMTENDIERFHGAKHFGAHVNMSGKGLNVGASGYTGNYAAVGHRRISIGDIDAEWQSDKLMLKAEAAITHQAITGGHLDKVGAYALASYRVIPELEPVLRFDMLKLDQAKIYDRTQLGIGLDLYPYPEKTPTVVFKGAYLPSWDGSGHFAANRVVLVLGAAF